MYHIVYFALCITPCLTPYRVSEIHAFMLPNSMLFIFRIPCFLFLYLPIYLFIYLNTYLPISLPCFLPTSLPPYRAFYLSTLLPTLLPCSIFLFYLPTYTQIENTIGIYQKYTVPLGFTSKIPYHLVVVWYREVIYHTIPHHSDTYLY